MTLSTSNCRGFPMKLLMLPWNIPMAALKIFHRKSPSDNIFWHITYKTKPSWMGAQSFCVPGLRR
ncbi:unnamed protein product [Hymenolepis diminuta]|uniref:Uncharacterized protein n=1 Tax=Hymenolepis diminuta TaxID=6216 RepID=A0A564ZA10_HYMDI|nr:unnamed protein product [Hymenolepis diminuta]